MKSVQKLSQKLRNYVNDNGDWKCGLVTTDVITAADTIDKMAAAIELCEMALREWDNPILADDARRAIADIGVKNG